MSCCIINSRPCRRLDGTNGVISERSNRLRGAGVLDDAASRTVAEGSSTVNTVAGFETSGKGGARFHQKNNTFFSPSNIPVADHTLNEDTGDT